MSARMAFRDTVRAAPQERSLSAKNTEGGFTTQVQVTFPEKWLFENNARSAPREKSLFAKSGFSRKVAFPGRRARNASRKVTFRESDFFEKSAFSGTLRASNFWQKVAGFLRKVAFPEHFPRNVKDTPHARTVAKQANPAKQPAEVL